MEQQLTQANIGQLVEETHRRGDPKRGALVFYKSVAACIKCHDSGKGASPLGPDLTKAEKTLTDEYLVESILSPSKKIKKGFETVTIVTTDGKLVSGLVAEDRNDALVLRDAANLEKEIVLQKKDIDEKTLGKKSMMPEGLVATLNNQGEFYDLASYVFEIARGGPQRAAELKPSAETLIVKDDTKNLDHAGILRRLNQRDFESGKRIFQGLCKNCHGVDGNKPSLPTARAFGSQPLKFGADPYKMFLTLSKGNGLMGPMQHLSPKERYQVVHFIREEFMKPNNPTYAIVTPEYLKGLPKGTESGEFDLNIERDFGPALASQLGWITTSALTIKLGDRTTISYDLHTMNQTGVWINGFLNLKATQHIRGRGEGVPQPEGKVLEGLAGWQWGHDGTLDYSRKDLLPRGPLPKKWFNYKGHYLHGKQLILSYEIDGRKILELPQVIDGKFAVRHTLRIEPGKALILATATPSDTQSSFTGVISLDKNVPGRRQGPATNSIALSGRRTKELFQTKATPLDSFTASSVIGDTSGMTWKPDDQQRLVLNIPADDKPRLIDIICFAGTEKTDIKTLATLVKQFKSEKIVDPKSLIKGGSSNWPETFKTVGYPGLEHGAYALDTITIPESTPWNTWFRTSALDFFPDGRMVVSTHGGDIWIVSGIDKDLLNLKWKRFAGGLYEPFGVKVVDGLIYVTCKDRLTRLHDLNNDGEADFYESFWADTDVSRFFHAFNFDLHTDTAGNFYYAKCGQYTSYALPGSVMKISPDGKTSEVYCTGFRTPNGMGILPDSRLTVSDNQGSWMPASKISLVKKGGFYGYVQTHSGGKNWAPDGGRIDHTKVVPPKSFDQPLIWMPQHVDNSAGGQLWIDDPRWGPLSGRLLHTSFGKGWMFYLMLQEFDEINQAAIIKLPFDFSAGIQRARVNPADGQVYAVGLDGWNGGGRLGLRDQGVQRLRYTGKPLSMVTDCQVEPEGLRLRFNFPLDPTSAADLKSYVADHWNYHWRASYGSDMFSPTTDQPGKDKLNIIKATLAKDGKSVKLTVPHLKPVNQVHLKLDLKDAQGNPFREEIYWTINGIPNGE
ncbi:MAG: c-type cytochrome [Planctomycetes bacterium]|nr:c-type cytochrome [Planctomycetota bacterium]